MIGSPGSDLRNADARQKRRASKAARVRSGRRDDRLALGRRQRRQRTRRRSRQRRRQRVPVQPVAAEAADSSDLRGIDRRKLPHIAAGNGGSGGDLGFGFDDFPYPFDGTRESANAISATLSMASGGGGGGVFMVAETQKSLWERAGDGGSPSTSGTDGTFEPEMASHEFALPANASLSGSSVGGPLTLELALPDRRARTATISRTNPRTASIR